VKCYFWSIAKSGDETWTHRCSDQKYRAGREMWCWRRVKAVSETERVKKIK